jgi:hypothetical protein
MLRTTDERTVPRYSHIGQNMVFEADAAVAAAACFDRETATTGQVQSIATDVGQVELPA